MYKNTRDYYKELADGKRTGEFTYSEGFEIRSRENPVWFDLESLISEYYNASGSTRGTMFFDENVWKQRAEDIILLGKKLQEEAKKGNLSKEEIRRNNRLLSVVAEIKAEYDKYTSPVQSDEGMSQ